MAWAIRAKVLTESHGRSSEALKAAIHAVALDAGGTELVMLKSDLLEASGEDVKSDEALEKTLAKHPRDGHLMQLRELLPRVLQKNAHGFR
jgi:hypothetical protein